MNIILSIVKKELGSFFNSLSAYIILVLFLGFTGFFTWMYGSDVFFTGQASLTVFFGISKWIFLFFIPAITMRLVAEERRTGTIELLLTMPVTDRQVIVGKFLSALALILVALLLTLPYVITLANIGNLDNGGTIAGYLGILLMTGAYASIGLYTSTLTNNQIVAFLLTLSICIFFHLLFGIIANATGGLVGEIISFLDASAHLTNIQRGVIDSRDLVFFLSIIVFSLALSEQSLYQRKLN